MTSVLEFITENIEKTVKCSPEDHDTLIGLPNPYTTPCISERFLELYYWDTYFTNVGLLLLDKIKLAKGNVDNMLFLVKKYGFMPNGNRTYYLNRSQPPFLSRMVKDIFDTTHDIEWLSGAYKILKKEHSFWQTKKIFHNGLNGYKNYSLTKKEVEEYARAFTNRIGHPFKKEENWAYAQSFLSFAESGWDCNSRFDLYADRYCSVDLNSLLFNMEENLAAFARELKNGEEDDWCEKAGTRRRNMKLLWDESQEIFTDYNPQTNSYSDYFSAASFYPLFCGLATKSEAEKTIKKLDKLELKFGISAGEANPKWNCQWDAPIVWAPIQFVIYNALQNYGYTTDAERIARKYIALIDRGFEKTGSLWEKYNGCTGEVISIEYDTPPMMGWTAGVYLYFIKELL